MRVDGNGTGRTVTAAMLVAVLCALGVGATTARDENDIVERALVRLENLDRDPLELPPAPPAPESVEVRERLTIARSIRIVETAMDTSLAVLTGDVLPILSLARNHRHLGLRQRALQWYDRAEIADKKNEYTTEILSERTEVALELGDSTLVTQLAGRMLDREDRLEWTSQLAEVLAFYASLPSADDAAMRVARRIESIDGSVDAQCLIEIARLHQRRDDDTAALATYRALLRRESRLEPRQMALTLQGLADAHLALGNVRTASALLNAYREHDTGHLSAWATYQLAGLAATAGRFDEAAHFFRSICERERPTPWRDDACTRLAQIGELKEIDAALAPYGRSIRRGEEKR